jgi:hypothetical protein
MHRVGRVERAEEMLGEPRAGLGLGEPEIGERALGRAGDQAGIEEELQVARDARLALPEDGGEVLDGEVAGREQRQDSQPRRLAGGPQRRNHCIMPEPTAAAPPVAGTPRFPALAAAQPAPGCLVPLQFAKLHRRPTHT